MIVKGTCQLCSNIRGQIICLLFPILYLCHKSWESSLLHNPHVPCQRKEPIYGCFPMSLEGSWVKGWLLWIDDDKKSLRTVTDSYKWQSEVHRSVLLRTMIFFQNMASTLPFSRMTYQSADWLWFPKFWGKNNFVVCQKLSICLFEYFASKKHCTASFMPPCYEVLGWCMLEGMTPSERSREIIPGNLHDLLWLIGHSYNGAGARKHGRSALHHNLEILNAGAHVVLSKSRKHLWSFPLLSVSFLLNMLASAFHMIGLAQSIILLSSVLVLCAQGDLMGNSPRLSDFRFGPECQPYHTIISSS